MIVCNKDLANPNNLLYQRLARAEVTERLGLSNPVTLKDISSSFQPEDNPVNQVLVQIWQRVVSNVLGNRLPFGRLYDHVFGLGRFLLFGCL